MLPRVRGNILSTLITPIPTRGVSVEVKTLELWTRIVIPTPTSIKMYLREKYFLIIYSNLSGFNIKMLLSELRVTC